MHNANEETTSSKHCPRCGAELEDSMPFCSGCGLKIEEQNVEDNKTNEPICHEGEALNATQNGDEGVVSDGQSPAETNKESLADVESQTKSSARDSGNPLAQNANQSTVPAANTAGNGPVPSISPFLPQKKPSNNKQKLVNIIGICAGIVIVIAGFQVIARANISIGTEHIRSYTFGADFYTEQYAVTVSAVSELNEIARGLTEGINILIRACGSIISAIGASLSLRFASALLSGSKK
uniref:zinc-ribbon domain-containing protein n=1 Tax=Collinsella bouchesdurhonensis TaxID=1907654 RepID=UPI00359C4537